MNLCVVIQKITSYELNVLLQKDAMTIIVIVFQNTFIIGLTWCWYSGDLIFTIFWVENRSSIRFTTELACCVFPGVKIETSVAPSSLRTDYPMKETLVLI